VQENDIQALVPAPEGGLTGYRRAVRLALGRMRDGEVETSWQDSSIFGAPSDPLPSDPNWSGHTVYTDDREIDTSASPEQLWRVIEGIGGENGWYSFPLAWAARGWMDRLAGGVGLQRGRRSATTLGTGDAVDWWRVEKIDRGHFLRLRAEFKAPGRGWLEMWVEERDGGSHYRQRAVFFPTGLSGRLYWYSILPFHGIIFSGMLNRIAATAEMEPTTQLDSTTAVESATQAGSKTQTHSTTQGDQR
jgi:hypothetical protein